MHLRDGSKPRQISSGDRPRQRVDRCVCCFDLTKLACRGNIEAAVGGNRWDVEAMRIHVAYHRNKPLTNVRAES